MKQIYFLVIIIGLSLSGCQKDTIQPEVQYSSVLEIGNENSQNIDLFEIDSSIVFHGDSSRIVGKLRIDFNNDEEIDIHFYTEKNIGPNGQVIEKVEFYHDDEGIRFYGSWKDDTIFQDFSQVNYPFPRVEYNSFSDYPRSNSHIFKEVKGRPIPSIYHNKDIINLDNLDNGRYDEIPLGYGWLYFCHKGGYSYPSDQFYFYFTIGTTPIIQEYLLFKYQFRIGDTWKKKYGWIKFSMPNSYTINISKIGITKKNY